MGPKRKDEFRYNVTKKNINLKPFRKIAESFIIAEQNSNDTNSAEIPDSNSTAKSEPKIEFGASKPTKWKSSRYSDIELSTNTGNVQRYKNQTYAA